MRGPIGRPAVLALLALAALAAGPVASASASVTIDSPADGTLTNDRTPAFEGSAEAVGGAVTVSIHEGSSAAGPIVQAPSTAEPPLSGSWSLTLSSPLSDGVYTAVAEQSELGGLGEPYPPSGPVTFTVDATPPAVSLDPVASPTKDPTPTLEGTAGTAAGDEQEVVLQILSGESVIVEKHLAASSGSWSFTAPHLGDGAYTARATQTDEAGNRGEALGEFTVDTTAPSVSLNAIPSPSGDATPTLTGDAGEAPGDAGSVSVTILSGSTEVASGSAEVSEGVWSYTAPHLADGSYTARAKQSDAAGNEGTSLVRSFTIDTSSPTVTLDQPQTPSNDTTPSFSGTASDTEPVTVRIYEEGSEVATATATGTGGAWSSGPAQPALPSGTHTFTAIAIQQSSLGNPAGESNSVNFTVDTSSPTVHLDPPPELSNNTKPSFTGTASDTTTVTVQIYAGSKAQGTPVSSATAPGTGAKWESGEAGPALADGEYTAIASQPSSLGNPPGVSAPVTFVVDTQPPHVTLDQPKTPSNDTTPSFTGTASDTTTVKIEIHAGPSAEGPVVSEAAATGTGGKWKSGEAGTALADGEYTAVASQPSSIGNPTGVSAPVRFVVDTRSPTVTLNQPPSPTNDTTPTFTGTATDTTKVVVHIFNGAHTEVASATATPSAGAWSTSNESSLADGTYTATATQESSLGNPAGESNTVTFTVNTSPPAVTLNQPAVRSNNTTPTFTGTASDTTTVTILVYKGAKAEGSPASSATATGTGGAFTSSAASPKLLDGEYTAIAKQPSSLGNPEGKSAPVKFTVDTTAPSVTLNSPPKVSNNTKPSFTGTASDTTTVTVQIFKGSEAKGTVVASATAPGTGGAWTSGPASPALADGQYTAIATQPSSLGNPSGVSAPVTFTVNTKPPSVTLESPPTPSNNTTPSFTGTATDTTTVTVKIYAGAKAEGAVVSTATGAGTGGAWSSGKASPALTTGQYTAIASQPSSIGNEEGKSAPVTFKVDTTSPTVTLSQPPSPSSNTTPSFKGTASAKEPVTVKIYEGTKAEGSEVSSATATGTGGAWTSGTAKPALASGTHTYTAVAIQNSPLGNPPGRSAPVTFTVNTLPPTVTLNALPKISNNTTPVFEGTASETTTVTVKIYEGKKAEGTVKSSATAAGTGGAWTSNAASPALPTGEYTAVATQPSSIGNPAGVSASITFKVDTNAPTVVLNPLGPRINDPTPSFTGVASDKTTVTVDIFAGSSPCSGCKPISTATAPGTGGGWSSGEASPALSDGEYAAVAVQPSSIGNHLGESKSFTFVVDTIAPNVTLGAPANGSSGPGESWLVNGGAGTDPHDLPLVTAQLFSGSSIAPGQAPLQSIAVKSVAGNWSATFGGLGPGSYTVRAEQSDDAGNVGESPASTFVVTQPAAASARPPAPPSASFSWLPSKPRVGETVSLVSGSSDAASPIISFAWDLAGNGSFAIGSPAMSTTFATPGNHLVQLRVTDANGLSSVAAQTIPVEAARLALMQPFPIVRIASTGTRSGAKLRLLSVLAAPGAQITVQCTGRRCPLRSQSHLAAAGKKGRAFVEFRRFERSLKAGVILEIRVTRAGVVGKYTRLRIRRGKLPLRTDACLAGLATKPIACPAS
jgi:hypothetical protein